MPGASDDISIFTDGACQPNPGPGGFGVIIVADGQRREFSGGFRKTTNNRMELYSVIFALRALPERRCRVTVFSDAQYVVRMINGGYAQRWRRDGWTRNGGKEPALNPDLWGPLLDLCAAHDVSFVWVRGHAEHPENTRCDELAVAARQQSGLPIDTGFESPAPRIAPSQLSLFP
jgi:ribonuclease HI